jgi:hypothetical protein
MNYKIRKLSASMMMIMNRNLLSWLALISISSILLLSLSTWRWADDFALYVSLRDISILEHMWNFYMQWDGRFLSLGAFLQSFAIKYLPHELSTLMWTSFFIISSYLFVELIILEMNITNQIIRDKLIFTAMFASVFWIGIKSHIAETVYWATGGVYSFSNCIGLLYALTLVCLRNNKVNTYSIFTYLYFFIISIVSGMLSHSLTPALWVLLFFNWIDSRYFIKSRQDMMFLLAAIGLAVATAIVFFAPGNFVRAAHITDSFVIRLDVLAKNYIRVLIYYCQLSTLLVCLSIICGFVFYYIKQPNACFYRNINYHNGIIFLRYLLIIGKYFCATLATIVPFIVLPNVAVPRASIFFMTFLTIFLTITIILINDLLSKLNLAYFQFRSIAYIIVSMLYFVQLGIVGIQLHYGLNIKHQISIREQYLMTPELKNSDVVLPPMKLSHIPFSLRFNDITSDATDWINQAVANYYGLRSIRAVKLSAIDE